MGAVVPSGAPKPIQQRSFEELVVEARKAMSIFVVSNESLRVANSGLFDSELERAVTVATDSVLVADLFSTAWPVIPASGNEAAAAFHDWRQAIRVLHPKAASKIFAIAHGDLLGQLGFLDAGGVKAFDDLGVPSGLVADVRFMGVDAMPTNAIAFIDASKVVIDPGIASFDSSREAILQMSDAPDNQATAATVMSNLFQKGLTASRCERYFGLQFLSDAVVVVTGADYGNVST